MADRRAGKGPYVPDEGGGNYWYRKVGRAQTSVPDPEPLEAFHPHRQPRITFSLVVRFLARCIRTNWRPSRSRIRWLRLCLLIPHRSCPRTRRKYL